MLRTTTRLPDTCLVALTLGKGKQLTTVNSTSFQRKKAYFIGIFKAHRVEEIGYTSL
jgi:hypothetical protein